LKHFNYRTNGEYELPKAEICQKSRQIKREYDAKDKKGIRGFLQAMEQNVVHFYAA